MTIRAYIVGLLTPLLLGSALRADAAPCDRALRRLEGWTIIRVGSVRGTFEGCDFDRLVELTDGTILRCSAYGYQYAYMPDAVVFGKSISVSGQDAVMIKLMVEGELYDMAPIVR